MPRSALFALVMASATAHAAPRIERAVCSGPEHALAVGTDGGERATLRWDGKQWSRIGRAGAIGRGPGRALSAIDDQGRSLTEPQPPIAFGSFFVPEALRGFSGNTLLGGRWTIESENNEFFIDDRVLRWIGGKIVPVSTGVRATDPRAKLHVTGLDATSDRSIWAVGSITTAGKDHSVALHFDGKKWKRIETSTPYPFTGVFARTPRETWIFGGSPVLRTAALYRFDGKRLFRRPVAEPIAGLCADDKGALWQVTHDGKVSRLVLPPTD